MREQPAATAPRAQEKTQASLRQLLRRPGIGGMASALGPCSEMLASVLSVSCEFIVVQRFQQGVAHSLTVGWFYFNEVRQLSSRGARSICDFLGFDGAVHGTGCLRAGAGLCKLFRTGKDRREVSGRSRR